jgi:pimeloyl-ACP methyl ester carboxylesterase
VTPALRLHVELSGVGPPVVLLHGFTGSTRSWDEVRDTLAQHCTVLAVDLPGHGRSPAPDDPSAYALDRVAEYLAAALDDEGLTRAAVVHPERCAALVLESTSPGIVSDAERAARRAADEDLARRLESEGIEAFVDRWEALPLWESQRLLEHPSDDTPRNRKKKVRWMALRERVRAQRLAQSPTGLANSLRGAGAGAEPPVLDDLPSLEMPVLLLAGALDPVYAAHARAMASRLPQATVYVDHEAGHALHLEVPGRVASLVHRFLVGHNFLPAHQENA